MRKSALILVMALMSLVSYAQQDAATAPMKFGFLSYDSVMVSMPEYVQVQTNLTQLRTQYEAEQQRVADDFMASGAIRRPFCRSVRANCKRCSTKTSPSRRRASVCWLKPRQNSIRRCAHAFKGPSRRSLKRKTFVLCSTPIRVPSLG